jgi:hypothetical protein
MLYEVLNFLKTQLESYISDGRKSGEPLIQLSNPWSVNDDNHKSSFLNSISLINVEEEKIFKTQEPLITQNKNGSFSKREPDLKLNLYILISAYNKQYDDGLKFLSKVVSFFQQRNVFRRDDDDLAGSNFPDNIEKLLVELYTAGFEQQNQIWASLSIGYVPSVIYKLRMVIVDAEPKKEEYLPIKEIKAGY